jgi:transcriptional regulator with XRE-family HTH domain
MKRDFGRTQADAGDSSLARRLHALRLQRGWNMDRVAAAAGISRTTLFHLERNEIHHPRASTLHKLAGVFDVPVESLQGEFGMRSAECGVTRHDVERRDGDGIDLPEGQIPHSEFPTPNSSLRIPHSALRTSFDRATNPIVTQVAAEQPELFVGWSPDDWDELYSQFATGGALREEGVQATAARINHDREVLYRLRVILQTHLADVASGMVDTLYKLVSVEPAEERPADSPDDERS